MSDIGHRLTVGPAIGSAFPRLRLPDQTGTLRDVHEDRAGRPGVVVVYRSAVW